MEQIIKQLNEFISTYVEGTDIAKVEYINTDEGGKWVISYNYDVEDDEFDTVEEMIAFMHADQYAELGADELEEDEMEGEESSETERSPEE